MVPVKIAEESAKHRLMTEAEAEAFLDTVLASAPVVEMSINDTLGRNRLGD